MDWLSNNWTIDLATSVLSGLIVAGVLKLLSRLQPGLRNATKTRWLLPIFVSIVAAAFLLQDGFRLDRDKLVIARSDRSSVATKSEAGSVENTLADTPRSVVEGGDLAEDISVVVDKQQCDTMLNEISTIPYPQDLDATVSNLVSKLIDEPRNVNYAAMTTNLDCAGRLAKKSKYPENNDRVLTKIIEANIQVGRCRAARELTDHLRYAKPRSEQKAKVARECLGRE